MGVKFMLIFKGCVILISNENILQPFILIN